MVKKICAVLALLAPFTLATPALAAGKPVAGVAEFKNQTSAGWWRGGVGWELSGMLANELTATEKFKIVERSKLQSVLREQDLAQSGRIKPGTGAQIGKLTGAQYLIMGTVTAYEENTSGLGGGISIGGISLGGKREEAYIAVDVRVVNTVSGEIDFVRTVEARSEDTGLNIGLYRGGFGGQLGKYDNTPAGKAIRGVIVEISEYLACAMVDRDSCLDEYKAKESKRREKTKGAIKLDE